MGFLRILLAISVAIFHTAPVGPFSWLTGITAVYAFFVISGFYIQMVLDTRYTAAHLGDFWIQRFYVARYMRLLPAYLVAFTLALALAVFIQQFESMTMRPLPAWSAIVEGETLKSLLYGAIVLFSNLTMFGLNVPSVETLVVGPSWSLGVEVSFYLLAPFLLTKSDRWLICLILIGVLLRFVPYNTHTPVLAGIDCFAMGALAYRHRKFLTVGARVPRKILQISVFAIVFVLVACSLPHMELTGIRGALYNLDLVVYPAVFALLIPTIFAATNNLSVDRAIGELSYPFYIFHEIVITLFTAFSVLHGGALAISVVGVTLIIATGVFQMEKRWLEPRRARLSRPTIVQRGALCAT